MWGIHLTQVTTICWGRAPQAPVISASKLGRQEPVLDRQSSTGVKGSQRDFRVQALTGRHSGPSKALLAAPARVSTTSTHNGLGLPESNGYPSCPLWGIHLTQVTTICWGRAPQAPVISASKLGRQEPVLDRQSSTGVKGSQRDFRVQALQDAILGQARRFWRPRRGFRPPRPTTDWGYLSQMDTPLSVFCLAIIFMKNKVVIGASPLYL